MATNIGISNNASGSGLNSNAAKSKIKSMLTDEVFLVDSLLATQFNPSWTTKYQKKSGADQVEDFSLVFYEKTVYVFS